mgnify:CR=1 FL=1
MYKKILIPVDVSVEEDTRKLLKAAKTLSENWDCELHVVTVIPNVGMPIVGSYFDEGFEDKSRVAVAQRLLELVAETQIKTKEHILLGTVYDCVINMATKLGADLIIIGAHQPELRDYLLGSNAARVVRHSKQSVLVMRDGTA